MRREVKRGEEKGVESWEKSKGGDKGRKKMVDNIWNKVIISTKTISKNNTFLI